MPKLRIASCNVEWMNDWFTTDDQAAAFKPTFTRDGQSNNTDKTARRTAGLIRSIDADILAIQEGPSRLAELQLFVSTYLATAGGTPIYECILGDSGAQQKLGVLYKPGSVQSVGLAPHPGITGLIDPWTADVDGDMFLDEYQFTRTPLVVDVTVGTHLLQLIVMHTKSNFVNQGESLWNNPATRQDYVVAALKARRRNATEGMRVRQYLDAALGADATSRIIVLGDLNDGPGLDYFERNYLAHNVTDVMLGSAFQKEWLFAHSQHDVAAANRYTAVFDDFVENQTAKKLLLDHILLSPGLLRSTGLRRKSGSGAIHHTEYLAQVTSGGTRRQNRPCDHRPVSVELLY